MTTANKTKIKGTGGEIVLYRTKDGRAAVDVRLEKETVWLSQKNMAVLFATERSVITKHLNNIFQSGELQRESNEKIGKSGSGLHLTHYDSSENRKIGVRSTENRGQVYTLHIMIHREQRIRRPGVN